MITSPWSINHETWPLNVVVTAGCFECAQPSVATAIADVFRKKKNGINEGRKFVKIMKILDKREDVKSRGVI